MTDVIARGNASARILEDQAFQDATAEYSKQLIAQWEQADSVELREQSWQQMQALKSVVNHLSGFMQAGDYEISQQKWKEGRK